MDVSAHGARHAMSAGSDRGGAETALIWSRLFRVRCTSDHLTLQEPQGFEVADLALDLGGQRSRGWVARSLCLHLRKSLAQ